MLEIIKVIHIFPENKTPQKGLVHIPKNYQSFYRLINISSCIVIGQNWDVEEKIRPYSRDKMRENISTLTLPNLIYEDFSLDLLNVKNYPGDIHQKHFSGYCYFKLVSPPSIQ